MQDPTRVAEMGRLGRQRVEQMFSVEREAAGVAAVYAQVWGRDPLPQTEPTVDQRQK
jgi:hypothetical protein